jgi:hypothetical protein
MTAERETIVIMGGLPPGEPMTAADGATRWTRNDGESLDAFKARVLADPIETTTGFVVFGGLP